MPSKVAKIWPKGSAKSPDAVLEQAAGVYHDALIIGWNKDGELDVRSNLALSDADALWLVEAFKMKLLRGDYHE